MLTLKFMSVFCLGESLQEQCFLQSKEGSLPLEYYILANLGIVWKVEPLNMICFQFSTWTMKKHEHSANMDYHNAQNNIVSRAKVDKVSASLKKRKRHCKQLPRRSSTSQKPVVHIHILDLEAPFRPIMFSAQATFLGCRFPPNVSEFQLPLL